MKIRNGFVSNSSSSSFIVSIKAENEIIAWEKIRKIIPKDSIDIEGSKIFCVGKEESIKYFKEIFDDDLNSIFYEDAGDYYIMNFIRNCGEVIKLSKNYIVSIINISMHDNEIYNKFKNSNDIKLVVEF